MSAFTPLVEPLPNGTEPLDLFRRAVAQPHAIFLDSALRDPALGRYSFVAADPSCWLEFPVAAHDPLAVLSAKLAGWRSTTVAGLPPFQGGAAGLISYDLNRSLERLPAPQYDEFGLPALAMGFYDVVAAFDHAENRGWLISQGPPNIDSTLRGQHAAERLQAAKRWMFGPLPTLPRWHPPAATMGLAPQFLARAGLTSNFTPDAYLQAVRRSIEYVRAGDIFQVNLAQRLLTPATTSAPELYLRLRERNPATFAGYFDLGDSQIASASPERFLRVRNGWTEARPIKGTRPRTSRPEADLYAADDLRESEKERAENVMIVDLLRNDLSIVCDPESVRVTELCELELYAYVQHLVSAVVGKLSSGRTPLDLVRAAFPGGSITGAPKIRAMEIIAELETTARGAYCGALGYLGCDGTMDLNILIRTITCARGYWQLPVGGGITAQSVPEREYEETWHKAAGLLRALTS